MNKYISTILFISELSIGTYEYTALTYKKTSPPKKINNFVPNIDS